MATLRQIYRPKLETQLAELARDLRAATDTTPVRTLWTRAHNMKGTSGSYGFRTVSDHLQRAENQLRPFREACAPLRALEVAITEVDAAAQALAAHLEG